MNRSRTAQLIVQSVYVALGLVAALGSTGLFHAEPNLSFYTKFTNISNYLALRGFLWVPKRVNTPE